MRTTQFFTQNPIEPCVIELDELINVLTKISNTELMTMHKGDKTIVYTQAQYGTDPTSSDDRVQYRIVISRGHDGKKYITLMQDFKGD